MADGSNRSSRATCCSQHIAITGGDILYKKVSFNHFPGKSDIKRRRNLCLLMETYRTGNNWIIFNDVLKLAISWPGLWITFFRILYTWFLASWLYINKIQWDATICRCLFTAKVRYIFRVSIAPIIRGTSNCNCSFWYRSYHVSEQQPSASVA